MAILKNDLTGETIGDLYVVKEIIFPYSGSNPNRKTIRKLEVRCRCGKIFYPYKINVTRGKTTGCLNCNSSKDLIGKTFDRLTVIKRDISGKIRSFICKCECGSETSVRSWYLRKGKSPKKCEKCRYPHKYNPKPKLNRKDSISLTNYKKHLNSSKRIIGKKINNFKILGFAYWKQEEKRRKAFYKCKCKCGNICYLRTDWIKNALSCGCDRGKLKGEQLWNAKLKDKEVKAIREMKESGMYSQRKVASMFQVNEQLISRVILRKSYKHVK